MSLADYSQVAEPQFTVREIAQVEKFAAQQSDAAIRAQFENTARSAITTGYVGDFTELPPNIKHGNHQLADFDPANLSSTNDDCPKAAKDAIDKVTVQTGAEFGTLNEATGAAETEAGSEWAAML